MPHVKFISLASLALTCMLAGCLEDDTLRVNVTPVANAGEDQALEPDGDFVTVTLDGSGSSDDDGTIVEYRWLNVQAADAGAVYGRGDVDPEDVEKPEVELGRGSHTFVLWVTDDAGDTSAPDRVTVAVGGDPVMECIDNTVQEVKDAISDPCVACACDGGEGCAEAIPGCEEDCWALIECIAVNCPTDADPTNCAIDNCAESLGGATQAQAAGPCLIACPDDCGR
ncbi:MAG: hypothetical protein OXT09_20205 [Myxococcales bacterium]|nr:hypothetical protein [Myxococcales bacterium]